MSTVIAINVEPEEDEEVEQTEEPNDDEGEEQETGENSVGDEEEGEPQPPPKRRRKKKRSFNFAPWICFFGVLLVIGLSIGLGVYFGVVKPKEEPKKPDDPKAETTKKPEEKSCYPVQNYAFLNDSFIKPGKTDYKISLFSGQVTHERMLSICDRINVASRRGANDVHAKYKGALYLNDPTEEKYIDDIIKDYQDRIFDKSGGKKLMWTGVSYFWSEYHKKWENLTQQSHINFCNGADSWKKYFEENRESLEKTKEKIYVVKNYEKDNKCWELYSAKELATVTGQPADRSPRLSFVCSFFNDKISSGKDAMPGHFRPKYEVGGKYIFYKVSATIEDAKKECEAHNSHLIQFKDKVEMDTLYGLRKDLKLHAETDIFWSGAYMDVSNGNKKFLTISPTWNYNFNSSGKDWLVMDRPLEQAADELIASIKTGKTRDCATHYVYAGLRILLLTYNELIVLPPMNTKGQLDQDSFTAYVACEKNN